MATAKHLIEINADKNKVMDSFTTLDGARGWWTEDAEICSESPKTFHFKFGSEYQNKMEVQVETDSSAIWKCVEGSDEWVGTSLNWSVESVEPGKSILRFSHDGWREATDFFAFCNTIWGYYMESIRLLCETGSGTPAKKS